VFRGDLAYGADQTRGPVPQPAFRGDLAYGADQTRGPVPQPAFRGDLAYGADQTESATAYGDDLAYRADQTRGLAWTALYGDPSKWGAEAATKAGAPAVVESLSVPIAGPLTTLDAAQIASKSLTFTGPLQGDSDVIVPDRGRWRVENVTTGAHRLTVKTAVGAGITIDQGHGTWVYSDGVNVLADPNAPEPRVWTAGGSGVAGQSALARAMEAARLRRAETPDVVDSKTPSVAGAGSAA
jgi:hypothetical protein